MVPLASGMSDCFLSMKSGAAMTALAIFLLVFNIVCPSLVGRMVFSAWNFPLENESVSHKFQTIQVIV